MNQKIKKEKKAIQACQKLPNTDAWLFKNCTISHRVIWPQANTPRVEIT